MNRLDRRVLSNLLVRWHYIARSFRFPILPILFGLHLVRAKNKYKRLSFFLCLLAYILTNAATISSLRFGLKQIQQNST